MSAFDVQVSAVRAELQRDLDAYNIDGWRHEQRKAAHEAAGDTESAAAEQDAIDTCLAHVERLKAALAELPVEVPAVDDSEVVDNDIDPEPDPES